MTVLLTFQIPDVFYLDKVHGIQAADHDADDHPLRGAGGDVERAAQVRQRDVHGRFGQHAQERADIQTEHHFVRMFETWLIMLRLLR